MFQYLIFDTVSRKVGNTMRSEYKKAGFSVCYASTQSSSFIHLLVIRQPFAPANLYAKIVYIISS